VHQQVARAGEQIDHSHRFVTAEHRVHRPGDGPGGDVGGRLHAGTAHHPDTAGIPLRGREAVVRQPGRIAEEHPAGLDDLVESEHVVPPWTEQLRA
jgi:hypothetical protein